ncbi:hypothetical protein Tco_0245734 [Tanacetum coccineum]
MNDDETREALKGTIATPMREEIDIVRPKMRNATMTKNTSGAMAIQEMSVGRAIIGVEVMEEQVMNDASMGHLHRQTRSILIMEYLVKIRKKARILELKRRNIKKLILTSYTSYPSSKIRCICACTSQGIPTIQKSIHRIQFPAVKGWLDEDLDNYHLKELRCSTQCHTQMSMWIISRGVVLLILLMEYKVLRDFLLHRSSINNSARLSNKFGGFYFSFKFDISGLLHQVITTIAYRIRDKDTSQSKQNLQSSSMTFIHKTLIIPSVLDSCFISSTVSEVKRLIQFMHTTMVPEQVKTMKIQAGIQVSRPRELTRQLQLWKRFGRLYLIVFVLVSNIALGLVEAKTNGSKPKPRINNQKSRNWPASKTIQKCVFNANHDHCVTKFLNEVNSRAKVPSNKTTNRNKPVEQINVAKKPERQISKGHRFSIKKTSVVHEKTMTPRSCLRWKPTGKIFKTVGLRWVPTGKIFTSSTTKVDSESTNGSDEDITNQYEYKQTLDVSAGLGPNSMAPGHNGAGPEINNL